MTEPAKAATILSSRWTPPAVWAGVILVLTSWPNPHVGVDVTGGDKVAHFSLYAVLGFLIARSMLRPRVVTMLVMAGIGIAAFGAFDEWHQLFVPGRDASVWDWSADALGAFVGLLLAHRLRPLALVRQDLPS